MVIRLIFSFHFHSQLIWKNFVSILEAKLQRIVLERKDICEALKGSLPSFHSEDKNTFIYVFQDDLRRRAWIGLRRKNSTFEWGDGSEFDFTSWNDGSPSYGVNASDCVHFVGHEDEGFTLQFK